VPGLGLSQPALGPLLVLLDVGRRPADLLVGFLEQLGQRELDVGGDPVDFREALGANLLEERLEGVVVQPGGGSGWTTTAGSSAGAGAAVRFPRTLGSSRVQPPEPVSSSAKSRSWTVCPRPSTTRAR
jgi:hypothetical protein